MASYLKLFNLFSSSKVLITLKHLETLNNYNKIAKLMRLLSNTNFECLKQIRASSCIYFQQGFVWFTSYAGMKKKPFDATVNLTCERKKKIRAALKFQAGVNFISDTCKHPLTRWNIHSVLQDSMFAYLVWLWFIWWSRLTNEPRKLLEKISPLKNPWRPKDISLCSGEI